MKVINNSGKVIFRQHGGKYLVFRPGVVVSVDGPFNLSEGLVVSSKVVKKVFKPLKKKVSGKVKKVKRTLKEKVLDLLDDGKLNYSNKK